MKKVISLLAALTIFLSIATGLYGGALWFLTLTYPVKLMLGSLVLYCTACLVLREYNR